MEFDNRGKLETRLYDKRDDFHFPLVIPLLYAAASHSHMVCAFRNWFDRAGRVHALGIS